VGEALANHLEIARLKDLQRERHAGEEHGVERENCEFHGKITAV
jgi:hypothetical protein